MSNRGYQLESFIERFLLDLADQKRDTAMSLRCHRITSSGAMRGDRGDVISVNIPFFDKQLLFECKRRKERLKQGMGFTLPESWLIKNETEAKEYDCHAIFVGAFTAAQTNRMFVVVDDDIATDFLHVFDSTPDLIIEVNKKKKFKIRKWNIDKVFSYLCASIPTHWIRLNGDTKNWVLISFDYFKSILECRKATYGKPKQINL